MRLVETTSDYSFLSVENRIQMSNEQNKKPGCLGFIGDYIIQLCGDYKKPL